jgi:hypothetical protein
MAFLGLFEFAYVLRENPWCNRSLSDAQLGEQLGKIRDPYGEQSGDRSVGGGKPTSGASLLGRSEKINANEICTGHGNDRDLTHAQVMRDISNHWI